MKKNNFVRSIILNKVFRSFLFQKLTDSPSRSDIIFIVQNCGPADETCELSQIAISGRLCAYKSFDSFELSPVLSAIGVGSNFIHRTIP